MSRVLFLTSNGTGLGHLTRAMAIARRLRGGYDPVFATLSAAAPVVEQVGFHVEYLPSHSAAGAGSPRSWDRRLRRRLDLLLDELRPELLVFDGAHPYDALIAILRARRGRAPLSVWCRRAMWRPGYGGAAVHWSREFDAVLEPGELAAAADRGLTVAREEEAERVAPIVFCDEAELLSREEACRQLGLDPAGPNALIALGQGPELDAAVERCLGLLARAPDLRVAALESSLSPSLRVPDEVVHLRGTYPMSRFYRAFDLAVAAAGYNALHELCAHGVPSLFVPMPRQTDDQAARAGWAQAEGAGRGILAPDDPALEPRLSELLDPSARAEVRARLDQLPKATGAAEAAEWLGGLVEQNAESGRGADPDQADGRRAGPQHGLGLGARQSGSEPSGTKPSGRAGSRLPAALSVSLDIARRIGPRLPLVLLRRARDRLRNPPPPSPKLAVIALGLPADDLIGRLHELARSEGTEPRRVLAITDSLELTALRRAGFAFEYVPAPERAARISDEPYATFASRRVEAALAARPHLRRIDLAPTPNTGSDPV